MTTLIFWVAAIAIGCVLVAALADLEEKRQRARRIARLRERRAFLDTREPKRWTT
jgi:Flp pilus assembly protein TadB